MSISLEYVAGFFDGEGGLSVASRNGRQRVWWRLAVMIGQNDPRPLELFRIRWGGTIARRQKPSGVFYEWRLATAQAQRFLEDIRPHLIVKADMVDIALEMRRTQFPRAGRNGLPPEEIERRTMLRDQLRVLIGHRGRLAGDRKAG